MPSICGEQTIYAENSNDRDLGQIYQDGLDYYMDVYSTDVGLAGETRGFDLVWELVRYPTRRNKGEP